MNLKINLENIHSPCQQCLIHNHSYSPNDDICQRCEYNIAIVVLKEVLKQNDYCWLCKNVIHIKGGYVDCKLNHDGCKDCGSYTIDWNAIVEEYQLTKKLIKECEDEEW